MFKKMFLTIMLLGTLLNATAHTESLMLKGSSGGTTTSTDTTEAVGVTLVDRLWVANSVTLSLSRFLGGR